MLHNFAFNVAINLPNYAFQSDILHKFAILSVQYFSLYSSVDLI